MMTRRLFIICICCVSTLLAGWRMEIANAQEAPISKLPEDIFLLSEFVEVPFLAQRAQLVIWQPEQGVSTYPAHVELVIKENSSQYFVGALINLNRRTNTSEVFYSFVLSDEQLNSFATPMARTSYQTLMEQERSLEDLEAANTKVVEKIKETEKKMEKLEVRATELRNMISEIVGVEDIIKLRAEAAALRIRNNDLQAHRDYLVQMQEIAKKMPEVEDIDILRKELNSHLQATAEATALADRLVKRRKQAAIMELQNKVLAVREAANEDPKALAKTALELRAERKRLEMKVGRSVSEHADEF